MASKEEYSSSELFVKIISFCHKSIMNYGTIIVPIIHEWKNCNCNYNQEALELLKMHYYLLQLWCSYMNACHILSRTP